MTTNYLSTILGKSPRETTTISKLVNAGMAQMARTVFSNPRVWFRNRWQNAAFERGSFLNYLKSTKELSTKDIAWFNRFVNQRNSIHHDVMRLQNTGNKIPLLKNLNEFADKLDLIGRSDETNRLELYRWTLSKVRTAIEKNPNWQTEEKEFYKVLNSAKLGDFQVAERNHALEALARGGEDAFARYIARAKVLKIHFNYDRAARSSEDQGDLLTRAAMNLTAFRRGYAQRVLLDLKTLFSKPIKGIDLNSQTQAAESLLNATVQAFITGAMYTMITGAKSNPYSALGILDDLSFFGLHIAAQQQISETFYWGMQAVTSGDVKSLDKFIKSVNTAEDIFIPFYQKFIDILDVMTGTKDFDTAILTQMSKVVNSKAKSYDEFKRERSLLGVGKKIIFGTEEKKEPKRKSII